MGPSIGDLFGPTCLFLSLVVAIVILAIVGGKKRGDL